MSHSSYQVLARKYRPTCFADLKGQEALVRTLSNAISSKRIPHAFVLTGIRGVGKTTTARIIARSLNCVGLDGTGDATIDPCGKCAHCLAISEDRHPDVLEMDAASRTGVNDIREIIENSHYLPVMARYKIYIIDEVHMLSTNAFNALLKTLEEPPAHVKFIFATTELRKIPITILSRCQRFDLRRLSTDNLKEHLQAVAEREGIKAEAEALLLIAGAAEGSVRDSLSLLDQAIAHSHESGTEIMVKAALVREMLGISDKGTLFDLFEQTVKGQIKEALALLRTLYQGGGDPLLIMEQLLEISHLVTLGNAGGEAMATLALSEVERKRSSSLAQQLSIPELTKIWQLLLKGLQEIRQAPDSFAAAEMILIRVAYAAPLPSPAAVIKALEKTGRGGGEEIAFAKPMTAPAAPIATSVTVAPTLASAPVSKTPATAPAVTMPRNFKELVQLFLEHKEMILHHHLLEDVHLVHFSEGTLEFKPSSFAPSDLAARISQCLQQWTGTRWAVKAVQEGAAMPTLQEEKLQKAEQIKMEAANHPVVKAALESFPGSKVTHVEPLKT